MWTVCALRGPCVRRVLSRARGVGCRGSTKPRIYGVPPCRRVCRVSYRTYYPVYRYLLGLMRRVSSFDTDTLRRRCLCDRRIVARPLLSRATFASTVRDAEPEREVSLAPRVSLSGVGTRLRSRAVCGVSRADS